MAVGMLQKCPLSSCIKRVILQSTAEKVGLFSFVVQSYQFGLVTEADDALMNLDVNISFEPSPDYPGIAMAAGNAWGATIKSHDQVDSVLEEAVNNVKNGKSAIVEVR